MLLSLVQQYGRQHAVKATNRTRLTQGTALAAQMRLWTERIGTNLDPAVQIASDDSVLVASDEQDDESLRRFWSDLACAGSGAPFVLLTLIDVLGDTNAHTVPRSPQAKRDLVNDLLAKDCNAAPVITDSTRMLLRDLLRARAQAEPG